MKLIVELARAHLVDRRDQPAHVRHERSDAVDEVDGLVRELDQERQDRCDRRLELLIPNCGRGLPLPRELFSLLDSGVIDNQTKLFRRLLLRVDAVDALLQEAHPGLRYPRDARDGLLLCRRRLLHQPGKIGNGLLCGLEFAGGIFDRQAVRLE